MSAKLAEPTYYVIIAVGYLWAIVQFVANEPFDALVLALVTFSFQSYRNAVRKGVTK